ncbi:MAG: phosphoribosyltransferase [Bacteroidetes bacterium]|jgi:predicted phosphoribosyltransferase|nr:phosphoribosyltransferase [Bacteroidota bacterium]
MLFKNRNDAAVKLAKMLHRFTNVDGVVLGVPRGGVPIAYEIARELNLPLEVILSKKIGHPLNPEFAIGSVSLDSVFIDPSIHNVSNLYIDEEIDRISARLIEKYRAFMGNAKPLDLRNKTVIVADDGIATGNTLLVIIDLIKNSSPSEIIIAAPVSSESAFERLSREVDEIVCLEVTEHFRGVGEFYIDFTPTTDQEVVNLLAKARDQRSDTNLPLF